MIFFDTACPVRLYLDEKGSEAVRALAETVPVASSWHAQAELHCTFHRAADALHLACAAGLWN